MSTRRYRVVHTSTYAYTGPISASHNEIRMTPLTEEHQVTLESRLRIRPLTWSHTYKDYWGTSVTALETAGLHESLELEAISTVECSDADRPQPDTSWEELRSEETRDRCWEWLSFRARTALPDDLLAWFSEQVEGLDPVAAVARAVDLIHEHLAYEAGVTVATTNAAEAWEAHKGVCQDFVHITLGVLRHLGVPARYVSGYLTPDSDAPVGEAIVGESHAWVEWFGGAWLGIDPTNLRAVGVDHIVVARGRDYDDVAPFTGVYLGDEEGELSVEVTVTRLS
ncbi:transglutaminase family protein [Propioniciclava soli]|uniref:Transglutaminase family protein n=1 Tax=Propioniciclava soli TaxID=2775081 RepID=A0ABZ3C9H9_9ACTN